MNARIPDHIRKFCDTYKVSSEELWEVRQGGAWAIKHSALERVAAEQKITFDMPMIIEHDGANKVVAMVVSGNLGQRAEWSIGEASPANNKNAYCYAMAEKRAKDRVVLKLLNTHGAIYSDAEADEIAQSQPMQSLPKKDARGIYEKLQDEVRNAASREQLRLWAEANKDRIRVLPEDWQDILRLQYEEQLADLRNREPA